MVCCRDGTLTIIEGELHVFPPSTVFEKNVGPRKAAVCKLAYGLPFGNSSRSHTAYATPALIGLAVTDSLSLKNCRVGSLLAMSTLRLPQVMPPSVETAAATELLLDWLK